MKFLARSASIFKDKSYLNKASLTYFFSKISVMLFFFYFVDCESCANPKSFIIRGLIHAVLFSHFIFIGLLFAVRLLAYLSFAKACIFLVNIFLNQKIVINTGFSWEILSHSTYGGAVFIIPAVLHGLITYMLVRALVYGRERRPAGCGTKTKSGMIGDKSCPMGMIKDMKNWRKS